jgi:Nitrogenase component 1 type Oxidoreductase.
MLKNLRGEQTLPEISIRDASGSPFFHEGVEYSPPARGTWTIAHVPMLIPHAHEIFIGGDCCLRGVVLSAAEFGGLDRFSMVTVKEDDVCQNRIDEMYVDGITDILRKLPSLPPAAVVFANCIHEFMACDMDAMYRTLHERFPGVDFIPSSMNPTMRKAGMTPEERMRMQLYAALEPRAKDPGSVNIVGNVYARNPQCELVAWLTAGGYTVRDICSCREYDEYKALSESSVNVYTIPLMHKGAKELERRLGQEALYLPVSFSYAETEASLTKLASRFGLALPVRGDGTPDFSSLEKAADDALAHAARTIGDMAVTIDYAAVSRPFELARLLVEHGFSVVRVYTDSVPPGDEDAFGWLRGHLPSLKIHSTVNFRCRFAERSGTADGKPVLAVGQKAAYFSGTNHFVNIVENGPLWGFDGICRLARMMEDAALHESDMRGMIQVKAWGCGA